MPPVPPPAIRTAVTGPLPEVVQLRRGANRGSRQRANIARNGPPAPVLPGRRARRAADQQADLEANLAAVEQRARNRNYQANEAARLAREQRAAANVNRQELLHAPRRADRLRREQNYRASEAARLAREERARANFANQAERHRQQRLQREHQAAVDQGLREAEEAVRNAQNYVAPVVAPVAVVVVPANLHAIDTRVARRNDVAALFDFGNAERVARDIVNQPRSGATAIHVGGRVVYHSSAGSGSTNDPGSAFWVVDGDLVYVVAVGRHVEGYRARYRLYDQAVGVDISNVVHDGPPTVDLEL